MKAPSQTPFSVNYSPQRWDPSATLEIINPDCGFQTCVGYAPSQHRRCRNRIAQRNRSLVSALLERLALMPPSSRGFTDLLYQVAGASLCRSFHQNQADAVVAQWEAKIFALRPPQPRERKPTMKREQSERPMKGAQSSSSNHRQYKQEDARRETEEDDRRRKEQEQKTKQQEQEREQREQEARERTRQSAQQQREERERKAREQDLRERREWQQAWQSYVTNWAAFNAAPHEPLDPQQAQQVIPWPVKSGRFGDVKASNVKAFYRQACPHAGTADMFKTMQAESLKWHPDKMCKLYPTCSPGEADKLVIEMICRVVLEVREEAKGMRGQ